MVEALEPSSSSSESSEYDLPFVRRVLYHLKLPNCETLEEGIEILNQAVRDGAFDKEHIDHVIGQVY